MEWEGGPTYAVQPRLASVWSRWIAREPMTALRASLAGRTRERIRNSGGGCLQGGRDGLARSGLGLLALPSDVGHRL